MPSSAHRLQDWTLNKGKISVCKREEDARDPRGNVWTMAKETSTILTTANVSHSSN